MRVEFRGFEVERGRASPDLGDFLAGPVSAPVPVEREPSEEILVFCWSNRDVVILMPNN